MPLPEVFSVGDAVRDGLTRQQLRTLLGHGTICRIQRGLFRFTTGCAESELERVRIAVARAPRGAVLTGHAAARMLGIATPRVAEVRQVDFIVEDAARPVREMQGVRITARRVPREHVITLNGIRMTSPAWTALELALRVPFSLALAPLDSALRGGVDRAVFQALQGEFAGRRGCRGLSRAIAEASPLAESGLESQSRGLFLEAGLPRPDLQLPVRIAGGRTMYVDFGWPQVMLAGEADGLVKYVSDGVYRAEKIREMQICRRGIRVERWTQWDLDHGAGDLLDRLFRYFDR